MAERAKADAARNRYARTGTFGTAAATAGQQFAWIWSRESIMRLALSLVLATALWLYVTNKQQPGFVDFGQPIAVTPINVQPGLIVANALVPVRVRFRLTNPNLEIVADNFHAQVNLGNKGPGTHANLPIDVSADPGIQILQVTPARVSVVVERNVSKRLQVRVRFTPGNPASGYLAESPVVQPNVINVSGPQSLISSVSQAVVEVSIAGAKANVSENAKPALEDAEGANVSAQGLLLHPPQVGVQVPIKSVAGVKTLPVNVPLTGSPARGLGVESISIDPDTITAKGPPKTLKNLTSYSTRGLSINGRTGPSFSVRVPLALPRKVSSATHAVKVTVKLGPATTSLTAKVPVTAQNLPVGLQAAIKPTRVLVTVIGPSKRLSVAMLHTAVSVNLSGYVAGTYHLAPTIVPPAGYTATAMYPHLLTIAVHAK